MRLYTSITAAFIISGIVHAGNLYSREEYFSTFLEDGSNVIIDNINGDIVIEEWSSESIQINYSINAETVSDIESVIVEFICFDGIICEVNYPGEHDSIEINFPTIKTLRG